MPAHSFETIDTYINDLFVAKDPILDDVEQAMQKAGLPDIQVSPGQGKFLYLMAKLVQARRILEIGTLGGYSAIWLARALPGDGKMITMESDVHHASVATENISRAGLAEKVEIMTGPALEQLAVLKSQNSAPFDLVFLDADKVNYVNYLDWALKLSRPGTLLLADNVVREGAVLTPDPSDISAVGAANFNQFLAADDRLESLVLQQVGIKGHDGIAIAIVK